MKTLCIRCEAEEHTFFSDGNENCNCRLRTCGCYLKQLVKQSKTVKTGP